MTERIFSSGVANWLPIADSPGYEVSDYGEVRSWHPWRGTKPPRILKTSSVHGYAQVVILTNGKRSYRYVHHLVLEAFIGRRPDGTECCHWNHNTQDNRLSNLRWDTRAGNMRDTVRDGTRKGENGSNAKLSNADVLAIKELINQGYSQRKIAAQFGVGKSTVGSIHRGESW